MQASLVFASTGIGVEAILKAMQSSLHAIFSHAAMQAQCKPLWTVPNVLAARLHAIILTCFLSLSRYLSSRLPAGGGSHRCPVGPSSILGAQRSSRCLDESRRKLYSYCEAFRRSGVADPDTIGGVELPNSELASHIAQACALRRL